MLAVRRAARRMRRGRCGFGFSKCLFFNGVYMESCVRLERRRCGLEEFDTEQLLRFGHGAVRCVVCPGDSDWCVWCTGTTGGREGLLMITLGERCNAKACKQRRNCDPRDWATHAEEVNQ